MGQKLQPHLNLAQSAPQIRHCLGAPIWHVVRAMALLDLECPFLTKWLLFRMHHFYSSKQRADGPTHLHHRLPYSPVNSSHTESGRVCPIDKVLKDADSLGDERWEGER